MIYKGIINILTTLSFLLFSSSSALSLCEKNDDPIINTKISSKPFSKKSITDGPYIFYEDSSFLVKWTKNNKSHQKKVKKDNFKFVKKKFGLKLNSNDILEKINSTPDYIQTFSGVGNLIAISDIHGQYETFIKLLVNHKVIDENLNWIFGNGHLVVLGDLMDRGPKVTESIWLVYQLEKKAEISGGKVHVLLGNHELMVLNNDIRYVHNKYQETSKLLNTSYNNLYSENSIIGNWLRKKPVIIKINDLLFVHAGISLELVRKEITIENANKLFINQITGKSWDTILNDSLLTLMVGDNGPVWYRGYFDLPVLHEYKIDYITKYFDVNHVIVGHTSFSHIISIYNNKILGIDSNIKLGNYGEVLIVKNNLFYRGTNNGAIIPLF
jgi:hypothetical protein